MAQGSLVIEKSIKLLHVVLAVRVFRTGGVVSQNYTAGSKEQWNDDMMNCILSLGKTTHYAAITFKLIIGVGKAMVGFHLISLLTLVGITCSLVDSKTAPAKETAEDATIIDSHVYREPGCPLVPERNGFNATAVDGNWYFVYGSISYFADLGHAVYGKQPTVSEIKNLCPYVSISSMRPNKYSNKTWVVEWTFPKHRRAPLYLNCWPQRQSSKSKFGCYFEEEKFHTYVLVAATDHKSWLLYIRCKIGVEANKPGEGMTWALLSRSKVLHPDVAQVAFGLLAGYGFDILSNKFAFSYERCN